MHLKFIELIYKFIVLMKYGCQQILVRKHTEQLVNMNFWL